MNKYVMGALLAALGCVGAGGCGVNVDGEAPADGDLGGESIGRLSEAFSVETCDHFDAYDHFIGETWSHHTVLSDKVDLLDTNDPAMHIYNAYNYDYSGECEQAFVTDVTARPSGNPAMTSRLTIQQGQVTGAMNQARCESIYFQYALYGQKFDRDGVWHHLRNNYFHGSYANGRCTLPSVTFSKIDWKDGISGLGKVGGLRYVVVAGEVDTIYKTCLALDPDDQGDHLNSLCPNITL